MLVAIDMLPSEDSHELTTASVGGVGKAKYKRVSGAGGKDRDLYQLLAYTVSVGLLGGPLSYEATAAEPQPITYGFSTSPLRSSRWISAVSHKRLLQQVWSYWRRATMTFACCRPRRARR
jgi:hypothetical protein